MPPTPGTAACSPFPLEPAALVVGAPWPDPPRNLGCGHQLALVGCPSLWPQGGQEQELLSPEVVFPHLRSVK